MRLSTMRRLTSRGVERVASRKFLVLIFRMSLFSSPVQVRYRPRKRPLVSDRGAAPSVLSLSSAGYADDGAPPLHIRRFGFVMSEKQKSGLCCMGIVRVPDIVQH